MSNKDTYKILTWLIFFFGMVLIGSSLLFMMILKTVVKIDPHIFYLNATNNTYGTDVYFYPSEVKETGLIKTLCEEIDGFDEFVENGVLNVNEFSFWVYAGEHQNEIIEYACDNSAYKNYLKTNNLSIESFRIYISKMSRIEEAVFLMSVYLMFVLICLVTLIVYKYRKLFYIIAAIVYLFATMATFSDGIVNYLFSRVISILASFSRSHFNYADMQILNQYVATTLKEALLTVIIFDTLIEIRKTRIEESIHKESRMIFMSMGMQIDYLKEYVKEDAHFIGKMKISTYAIEKECKRNIKRLSKKKCSNEYSYRLAQYRDLFSALLLLTTNKSDEYTRDEYIQKMKTVRELMIELNYSYS